MKIYCIYFRIALGKYTSSWQQAKVFLKGGFPRCVCIRACSCTHKTHCKTHMVTRAHAHAHPSGVTQSVQDEACGLVFPLFTRAPKCCALPPLRGEWAGEEVPLRPRSGLCRVWSLDLMNWAINKATSFLYGWPGFCLLVMLYRYLMILWERVFLNS